MKATHLVAYGDSSQIKLVDIPTPSPGPDEVLVKIAASGLNHVETFLRQGYLAEMMPLDLPATLGIDFAGEVTEVGKAATRFKKGDRVIGRLPATGGKGAHAEYAVATSEQLAKLSDNVSFEFGATLPLAGLTGRQAVDATGAKPGDRVLVTGALGSVGRVAMHYLKELGISAVALVQPARLETAQALGMETVTSADVEPATFDATVETVGGEIAALAIRATKEGGKVAGVAGFPEGAEADDRVQLVSVYSVDNADMLKNISDAAARGELELPIARTFPLDQLPQAYDYLAGRPNGKVVVTR